MGQNVEIGGFKTESVNNFKCHILSLLHQVITGLNSTKITCIEPSFLLLGARGKRKPHLKPTQILWKS